jgi:glycosyltransferase involved in cell wall biosynthesis
MRTALVHYWLVRMRGGEQVLKHLMKFHPDADVVTNVYDPERTGHMFHGRKPPTTTYVNRLPFARRAYPAYMPLMPGALEAVDMNVYDLIISSESGPAKWVIPHPNARHICYMHSPMRYLWDQRAIYRSRLPALARPGFDLITSNLRQCDVSSSARVDQFVANSTFVANRIERYYRRSAIVVPPPVEQDDFPSPQEPDDYYLFAGQLVGYKNVEVAVDACLALGRRLVVVGAGPGATYVKQFADRGVEYRGRVERTELVRLMSRCRALLFPGVEDFGIVPIEVMAAGRPVIALAQGGVMDYLEHRATGLLYQSSDSDGLKAAILDFEEWLPDFEPRSAVMRATRYSPMAFAKRWRAVVDQITLPHEFHPVLATNAVGYR